MLFAILDLMARVLVVCALAYASAVGLTHWAVRSQRINPFGAWPRLVRRASDPVLKPLERRIVRAGGSPQDASLWLVGIVILGGLLLLTLLHWFAGIVVSSGGWWSRGSDRADGDRHPATAAGPAPGLPN